MSGPPPVLSPLSRATHGGRACCSCRRLGRLLFVLPCACMFSSTARLSAASARCSTCPQARPPRRRPHHCDRAAAGGHRPTPPRGSSRQWLVHSRDSGPSSCPYVRPVRPLRGRLCRRLLMPEPIEKRGPLRLTPRPRVPAGVSPPALPATLAVLSSGSYRGLFLSSSRFGPQLAALSSTRATWTSSPAASSSRSPVPPVVCPLLTRLSGPLDRGRFGSIALAARVKKLR